MGGKIGGVRHGRESYGPGAAGATGNGDGVVEERVHAEARRRGEEEFAQRREGAKGLLCAAGALHHAPMA
ncbi:hypothetical protein ACFSTD_07455 [Novosphingobium colocasiae]|uniref:Uncharacterized protein n=1 Tax=Novosphingobium colocasiae TaxID=1256513 RepID=A0A918PJT3_9SPHN|nr:hypothetical protein GCM10011614_30050 [Novosphingobium colocasiae]